MRCRIMSSVLLLCLLSIAAITNAAPVKEITVMMGLPAQQPYIIEDIVARFEKMHPDIRVTMVNGADTKVLTAIASGVIPDAGTINQTQAPNFYRGGNAYDLTPFIQSDRFDVSVLPPSPESLQYQGRWYGMPQAGSAFGGRAIYYNRDLFSAAGLSFPTFKWTWSEFATDVQKLALDKDNNGTYERTGFSFGPLEWPIYLWSGGGDIMNDARTEFTLAQPKSVAALEFWANLTRSGVAASASGNFANGATAMRTGAFFDASNFAEAKFSFDWSVVEFPAGPAGTINRRGTHPWIIPVGAKYPKEAWEFIKFWLSDEIQRDLVLKWSWRPPQTLTIARELARLKLDRPPYTYVPYMGVNGIIRALPIEVNNWDQMETAINKALGPVWKGDQSALSAMEGVIPQLNSLMK